MTTGAPRSARRSALSASCGKPVPLSWPWRSRKPAAAAAPQGGQRNRTAARWRASRVARKGTREALTGAHAGGLLSREIILVRGADVVSVSGRLHPMPRYGERYGDLARSENLSMHGNISRENREVPCWFCRKFRSGGHAGAAAPVCGEIKRLGRRTVRPHCGPPHG